MNIKFLIGIIVVSVGLVIAGAISGIPVFITFGIVVAVTGWWIYLVWMVRKKKTDIFHHKMEPELAERRLRRLKIFLRVGGVSFVVGIVGVVGHNVVSALLEKEEPVFFTIGLVGLFVFFIATIGGLVIFLKWRRKTT